MSTHVLPTAAATIVIRRKIKNDDEMIRLRDTVRIYNNMSVCCDLTMWKPSGIVYTNEQDAFENKYNHPLLLSRMLDTVELLLKRKWVIDVTFYIKRDIY